LVTGPIAALHQDIGKQPSDHLARRRIVKNDNRVHAFQRRENLRALAFRDDGTAFTLQLTHSRVAIQPHDKHVAQCARLLQAADMAGMQQVKAAIGENDAAPVAFLAAKPQELLPRV